MQRVSGLFNLFFKFVDRNAAWKFNSVKEKGFQKTTK